MGSSIGDLKLTFPDLHSVLDKLERDFLLLFLPLSLLPHVVTDFRLFQRGSETSPLS